MNYAVSNFNQAAIHKNYLIVATIAMVLNPYISWMTN